MQRDRVPIKRSHCYHRQAFISANTNSKFSLSMIKGDIMKKIAAMLLAIIITVLLVGCSSKTDTTGGQKIRYRTIGEAPIGFTENDETKKPMSEDIVLIRDEKEWIDFKSKHFGDLPMPEVTWKSKDLIIIQAWWTKYIGHAYKVDTIKLVGNKLEVSISSMNASICISPSSEDVIFNYILFVQIDKKKINDKVVPILLYNSTG